MIAWPFGELRPFSFDLVMADPPTSFRLWSEKGEAKSPQAQYDTMTIEEIAALPVGHLAAKDCALWLWWTWPLLLDGGDPGRRIPGDASFSPAGAVMKAWGFRYVSGGAWFKRTVTGKPAFGPGYRWRSTCEPYLLGTNGNPATMGATHRNAIEGLAREHSRKPKEAYEFCETWIPGARRLDLFSRATRPGWTAWGKEAGKFDREENSARPGASTTTIDAVENEQQQQMQQTHGSLL